MNKLSKLAKFHKYKIKILTQNLVGLPVDNPLCRSRNLDFNIKLKPDYAWSSILYPIRRQNLVNWLFRKDV